MRTAIATHELLPEGLYLESLSIETGRVSISAASETRRSRCPLSSGHEFQRSVSSPDRLQPCAGYFLARFVLGGPQGGELRCPQPPVRPRSGSLLRRLPGANRCSADRSGSRARAAKRV